MEHIDIGLHASQVFIGGAWRAPASAATLPLTNPSDGSELAAIARGSALDVDAAVRAAHAALEGPWGRMSAAERGRVLLRMSARVLDAADELARLEALDVGKPLSQARNDALALARYLEFYGGAADKVMGQTIPFANGYTALSWREPHGVTGHIVPWNYPMQIIGRSVGAALAMGNACVLKPAEEACLSALAFARIAQDAGLPAGALNVVPGLGEEAGAALTAHAGVLRDARESQRRQDAGLPAGALNVVPGLGEEAGAALTAHAGVAHLSFTGSVAVGQQVQAAAARHTIPVTLELGGKSPQLVFADADLDAALPFLVNAGIQNAGQTCSAASRILVQRSVFDAVVERMAERYRALSVGPALQDRNVGPLVSARQREVVEGYLDMARDAGLRVAGQALLPPDLPPRGHYVAPTLLAPVDAAHRLAQEEIFGPVQVVIAFDDEADALRVANGTAYGLVAGVWTRDGGRALRMARGLKCGQVFINNYGAGGGIELPFGGVKASGHGREKGFEALYGFSALKTVAIKHD